MVRGWRLWTCNKGHVIFSSYRQPSLVLRCLKQYSEANVDDGLLQLHLNASPHSTTVNTPSRSLLTFGAGLGI